MAGDFFLKIGGLEGESIDKKYSGHIEVETWSWGAAQVGSMGQGTGGGTSKVSMQDFHFTMWMNKVTPELFVRCSTGEHYSEAKLICRKAGGGTGGSDAVEYLTVTFTDVMITSYQTGGAGSTLPMDQVSLNFTKVKFEYQPQGADGKAKGGKITQSYDIKTNDASAG